ncbi:pyridoxamine 5'-phosphate oxidase family protein [Nocardia miyunensis]|uniref:pyridoxamine 5'-phosphate oxidase family protein n=1 Tax=Nocardia miyunensis TaxID=282684 RepID=UPI000837621D|nr:pyridoxamine 5'-phosphate oxidase family protein [Nocardia miyunensis]
MPISDSEAMQLLAAAPYGRVVFTRDALPAIRAVNHLIEDGKIIVRTRLTSRLTETVRADQQVVVAYQADDIDPIRHTGWSVVVTGLARAVDDPARIARYEELLSPWADGLMDVAVEIEPSIISGIRLDGAS